MMENLDAQHTHTTFITEIIKSRVSSKKKVSCIKFMSYKHTV